MIDSDIVSISNKFRKAIEDAKREGIFIDDTFNNFPHQCCGDTSYLLGSYLFHEFNTKTIYVSGKYGLDTHAWLVVKDNRTTGPVRRITEYFGEAAIAIEKYGGSSKSEIYFYNSNNIRNGLIIDITGDQFSEYNYPVYVGPMDDFHEKFKFVEAGDCPVFLENRLKWLYDNVVMFIQ